MYQILVVVEVGSSLRDAGGWSCSTQSLSFKTHVEAEHAYRMLIESKLAHGSLSAIRLY